MSGETPPTTDDEHAEYIEGQVATLRRMIGAYADLAYNAGVLAGEAAGIAPVMSRMAEIQHFEKAFDEALRLVVKPPAALTDLFDTQEND